MEFEPPLDDDEFVEPPPSAHSDLSEGSDIPYSGDDDEEYDEDEEEYEFEDELDEDLEGHKVPGELDPMGGGSGVEGDIGSEAATANGEPKTDTQPKRRKRCKAKGDSDHSTAAPVKKRKKGKGPAAKVKKKRPSKSSNHRRDIKTLIRETELEAGTLAAQREEEERKKRLEEQRAQNASPPALLTQLLETNTSELLAEQRRRNIADTNEYILLDSSSGDEEKKKSATSAILERKGSTECIEILSSDEEEEVKVLSESEKESEPEFGPDQETSGTHTDDRLNLPDFQGRVLVNLVHPPDEPDIFLPPHLAGTVKPHQIGGIRFLYDNLVETIKQFCGSPGFGCILAHSMGLGKTLQVISFTDIFLRYTSARSVLIIVPINTLQNWIAEFEMWLPTQGDEASGWEGRKFSVFILNDTHKTTVARAKVIGDWYKNGGVMLMGYELYRLLCNRRLTGFKPRRRKKKSQAGPEVIDLEEEEKMERELDDIRHAICDPGPDLVVCDEGHRIKNSLAGISKALKDIKTRRRVVLTGYPLQNNLMEYWCMVDFVRPNYLGTKHEFSNLFERPITNGQCIDSTPADVRLMKYRAHVLHNRLAGFVQRRGFKVLKTSLPAKHEHVILVRLTQFQKGLYCKFMHCFKDAGAGGWCSTNPLKAFAVGCKIWNHPDILYDVLQESETDVDKDLDIPEIPSKNGPRKQQKPGLGSTTASASGSPSSLMDDIAKTNGVTSFEDKLENMSYQEKVNQILSFEWARDNMRNYTRSKLSNGGKMVLLFHIIDESIKVGDKILVFSQSLMTLSLIEKFLSLRKIPDPPDKDPEMCQNWIRNISYFRLDGSTASSERERLINQFNQPSNDATWLFLLSTRAGCLGVNLIGANRVVVLDASWNPCHDAQAVCRVYRYGQKKTCHIYRMVTDNTLEKKIYDRQISKKGMSDRVVDELNPQMNLTKKEVESLLDFDDSDMPFEDFGHLADDFEDHILQNICRDHSQMICKAPFSTESLLWDRKDQRLTRAEKAQARKAYEEEVKMNPSYNRPSYAAYYPKPDNYLGSGMPSASGGYEGSLPYLLNMRGQIQMPKRPVASVRPLQSTPLPKYPPGAGLGLPKPPPAPSPLDALKGLSVQRIVATTDILLPNANTLTNTTTKISAGETVTFIKTPRGIYLRTPEGRFIAVRGPNNKNTNRLDGQGQSSKETVTIDSDSDSPTKADPKLRGLPSSSSQGGLVNSLTSPLFSFPGYSNPLTQGMGSSLANSSAISTMADTVGGPLPPLGLPPFMYQQQGYPGVSITTPSGNFYHRQPNSISHPFSSTSEATAGSQMPHTIDLTSMFAAQNNVSDQSGIPGSSGVSQAEGSRLPATTQITASSSSDGATSMDITQLTGPQAATGLPHGNTLLNENSYPQGNGFSQSYNFPQGNGFPEFDSVTQGNSLPRGSGLAQVNSLLQGNRLPQGDSLPPSNSLPQVNSLPQGTSPPLEKIQLLTDNSAAPPLGDILPQGPSLHPSNVPTGNEVIPGDPSLIPGAPSLIPGTGSLPLSTVLPPFIPKLLPSMAPGPAGITSPFQKPLQGVAPGTSSRERLPFLSVPPQLPTLDANSVEEILNSTSSEGDSDPKEMTVSDVQSSNLASLSQFVSSSFPSSLSQM